MISWIENWQRQSKLRRMNRQLRNMYQSLVGIDERTGLLAKSNLTDEEIVLIKTTWRNLVAVNDIVSQTLAGKRDQSKDQA